MLHDHNTANLVARILLDVEAVKLNVDTPFQWASGWLSPIYCDNRRTLSYPKGRSYIKIALADVVSKLYPEAEVIAGVATGAISWGMLVADLLNLPFVYVRPEAKDHGTKQQVEGYLPQGAKVAVVEDLISTGGSSVKAVNALRNTGANVLGLVAVYTHGFKVADELFSEISCKMTTLSDYDHVITQAIEKEYISPEQQEVLTSWRKAPEKWGK